MLPKHFLKGNNSHYTRALAITGRGFMEENVNKILNLAKIPFLSRLHKGVNRVSTNKIVPDYFYHVMVLREFRDRHLLTNSYGRAFVTFYYRVSPPIADFISRHEGLKIAIRFIRFMLTPIIFGVKYLPWSVMIFTLTIGIVIYLKNSQPRFALRRMRISFHPETPDCTGTG
jgi:hypothetical protein